MKRRMRHVVCLVVAASCGGEAQHAQPPDGGRLDANDLPETSTGSPDTGGSPEGATDGAALPEVANDPGACGSLAAVGQWENITPPYVASHSTATGALIPLVSTHDSSVVYLMTDSDGVFKTTDCGATWVKTNTGQNASQLDSGHIWTAVIDPVASPDTLYAATGYGALGLWKSTNGGVDWQQLFPPGSEIATVGSGFIERIAMDPTNPSHLVVNFHENCTGNYTGACLGETTDGGATWHILQMPSSVATGWVEASGLAILKPDLWLYGAPEGGLFVTADHGATWTPATPTGGSSTNPATGADFPGNSMPFQAADGTYYLGTLQGIARSPDGMSWTLIPNSGHFVTPVFGDGITMYAGVQNASGNTFFYSAPYANLSSAWTASTLPGISNNGQGIYAFGYDPAHHLLYATAHSQGFWRMVTH
jgi:hypothetical protein